MKKQKITRKEFKKFIETEFPFLVFNSNDNIVFRKIGIAEFIPDKYYSDIERNIWLGTYIDGFFEYPNGRGKEKELIYTNQLVKSHLLTFIKENIRKNVHEIYRCYENEFRRLNEIRSMLFDNILEIDT